MMMLTIVVLSFSCSPMHTSSIYSVHSYSAHPSWAFVPFPLLALRSPLLPVRAMCLHDRARMNPLAFMTGRQHRSGRGQHSSSAGKGCRGGALELNARVREEESTLATRGYKIWYSVISPETRMPQRVYKQGTCTPLPIVVLHGGPGVPSDYLLPLKSLAAREQRKMFFYDQLGCGRSEGPKDESFYSVRQAAEDAMTMLNHFADFHGLMDLGGFHLYGHSWGGCLAAEIVMNQLAEDSRIQQGLASVVLSNALTSPQDAMNAARKLISIYTDEMWGRKPDEIGTPTDTDSPRVLTLLTVLTLLVLNLLSYVDRHAQRLAARRRDDPALETPKGKRKIRANQQSASQHCASLVSNSLLSLSLSLSLLPPPPPLLSHTSHISHQTH